MDSGGGSGGSSGGGGDWQSYLGKKMMTCSIGGVRGGWGEYLDTAPAPPTSGDAGCSSCVSSSWGGGGGPEEEKEELRRLEEEAARLHQEAKALNLQGKYEGKWSEETGQRKVLVASSSTTST